MKSDSCVIFIDSLYEFVIHFLFPKSNAKSSINFITFYNEFHSFKKGNNFCATLLFSRATCRGALDDGRGHAIMFNWTLWALSFLFSLFMIFYWELESRA